MKSLVICFFFFIYIFATSVLSLCDAKCVLQPPGVYSKVREKLEQWNSCGTRRPARSLTERVRVCVCMTHHDSHRLEINVCSHLANDQICNRVARL